MPCSSCWRSSRCPLEQIIALSNSCSLPVRLSLTQTRRSTYGRKHLSVFAHSLPWTTGCKLVGCGSSVPATVLSNLDLEKLVETNDEWIRTRTGIRNRHILADGENLSTHAAEASLKALGMAGVSAADLDLVLLATSSPDDLFGSACQVQAAIGAKKAVAFDVTAACSGFVIGLVTAAQFIRTGMYKNVLIIGADALSRYIDWRDRSTCILFGDGCGAVVMTAQDHACSLLGSSMHSDGAGQRHLKALCSGTALKAHDPEKASSQGCFANILMNGSEVFKFAVRAVPAVIEEALEDSGLTTENIDFLVLHQANQRILDSAAQRLGMPPDRVISNLANYGNTSAASIPLALDEAVRGGIIAPGSKVRYYFKQQAPCKILQEILHEWYEYGYDSPGMRAKMLYIIVYESCSVLQLAVAGFGAGLTWAAAILEWG